ncbi:MAG: NUDIX hydrolase [Planctomycetes bacterium]|nr:NUDIX hydrolase [Planctomycetota bacterium]
MNSRDPLPVVATGMVESDDGRVLICRRRAADDKRSRWELPAVIMRPDESPEAAMRRAAKQCVDLTVTVTTGQPPFRDQFDGRMSIYRFFVCHRKTGDARALDPYHEIRWIQPGQLIEYDYDAPTQSIVNWYIE